jgi:hypothetical protein
MKYFVGINFNNVTANICYGSGNHEVQYFEFITAVVEICNCYLERPENKGNVHTHFFRCAKELVVIDTTMIGTIRVTDYRSNFMSGTAYISLIRCSILKIEEFFYCWGTVTALLMACYWEDGIARDTGDNCLGSIEGSTASVINVYGSCFKLDSRRGCLRYKGVGNIIIKGNQNCFSLAKTQIATCTGVTVEDTSADASQFGCETCKDYNGMCPVRNTPAFVDSTVEDCIWSDVTAAAQLPINFKGASLSVRRCKFIKCGWTEAEGGCIQAALFTGDLLFDSLTFTECSGAKGSICVSSNVNKLVTLFQCKFTSSTYSAGGCLYAATGEGSLLVLEVMETEFTGCSVTDGTGVISTQHSELHVSACQFKNCVAKGDGNKGCFIYLRASTAPAVNASVIGCTFENGPADGGSVSSILIEGPGNDSNFVFRSSNFVWNSPSSVVDSVIEGINLVSAAFEDVNITFSSSATETQSVCGMKTVENLELKECRIQSSGQSAIIAIVCGASAILNGCELKYVGTGILVDNAGSLTVSFSQFEDINGNAISSTVELYLLLLHNRFKETTTLTESSFILMTSGTSTMEMSFCCFQTTNHDKKLAVKTSGSIIVFMENCFSHLEESKAISAGSVKLDGECVDGANHYECEECRRVCPTIRFSGSLGFISTKSMSGTPGVFSSTERMSLTSDLSESSKLGSSNKFTNSNEYSLSRLSETDSFSETSAPEHSSRMTNSDSYSRTNDADTTLALTKSNTVDVSILISASDEITKTQSFLETAYFHISSPFSNSHLFDSTVSNEALKTFLSTTELPGIPPAGPSPFPPAATVQIATSFPVPLTNPPKETRSRPSTQWLAFGQTPFASESIASTDLPNPTLPPASTLIPEATALTRSPVETQTSVPPTSITPTSMSPTSMSHTSIILTPIGPILVTSTTTEKSSTQSAASNYVLSSSMYSRRIDLSGSSVNEGTNLREESNASSDNTIWLIISIAAMVLFIALFSGLLYKESSEKEKKKAKIAAMDKKPPDKIQKK